MSNPQSRRVPLIVAIVFLVALGLQGVHLVEHLAQVYQHWWLGLRGRGIVVALDFEWNHFVFNTAYFACLATILGFLLSAPEGTVWRTGRPRLAFGCFALGTLIQSYHVVEHTVRMGQYLHYGCTPCPGLLGRWLDLVTLHFALNSVVWLLPLALLPAIWRGLRDSNPGKPVPSGGHASSGVLAPTAPRGS